MLIISDEANNYYCFAVKNLSKLNSLRWLQGKKEAIINDDNDFQYALDDALIIKILKNTPKEYQN